EFGVRELQGGKVDRHRPLVALLVPDLELTAGLIKRPVIDVNYLACLFGRRHELVRHDEPALGMLPAHQGFSTYYRAGGVVELWLIMQEEFVTLYGQAQFLNETKMLLGIGVHRRIEKRVSVAPHVLAVIHGCI